MIIIADENIPFAYEAFREFGEVRTLPGRKISAQDVKEAEVLLVRSVTRVDEALLRDASKLRFVGTATIGTDHVDTAYLAQRGIAFASAPGCNANSVAEYIVAALLELEHKLEKPLAGASLGIIGVGYIGSIVHRYAQALGMRCVLHDPPRKVQETTFEQQPIEAIHECDFITLHVPFEKGGLSPTFHLVDEAFLKCMKSDAVLLNTSRGAVVDNQALKQALQEKYIASAVLDVWEGEPTPDAELLSLCSIATPHIAGYSYDGKVKATAQLREALAIELGIESTWDPNPLMPVPEKSEIDLSSNEIHLLRSAMCGVYDIMEDDMALVQSLALPEVERGAYFDELRKFYRVRREAAAYTASLSFAQLEHAEKLSALGFKTRIQ